MTSLKRLGAALAVSALLASPASAWEAVTEPAAAAMDPNFSIYSTAGDPPGASRAIASQPFNSNAMAEMRLSSKAHRAHRAPVRQY